MSDDTQPPAPPAPPLADAIDDLIFELESLAALSSSRVKGTAMTAGREAIDQWNAERRKVARRFIQAIRRAIAQPNGRP